MTKAQGMSKDQCPRADGCLRLAFIGHGTPGHSLVIGFLGIGHSPGSDSAARERYLKLLQIFPAVPVATLMCRRCAEFMAGPPPTEWDTTFRMREK